MPDLNRSLLSESENADTLGGLTDVTLTAPVAAGDFLKYNGSLWINGPITLGTDTTGNYMSNVTAGSGINVSHTPGEGSSANISLNASLDDLNNVNAPSPTTGYFLKWDGSAWVPAAAGGAVTTTTISTNSETTVATFTSTSAKAAEFHIEVGQGSRAYSSKILTLHNGTTADFTKYGELSLTANEAVAGSGAVTWVSQEPNVGEMTIESVAYGNNLWVAAGWDGQIRTSTDTITWVTRASNFGSYWAQSVAYANNLWVAGAQQGLLSTSTDAITWVTQNSNFGTTAIKSVAFGNNLWVAGGDYGQLRTSTDAITWVTQTSNFGGTTHITSVAFGNSLWVAGGQDGQLRTSTDAITWVTQVSNFPGNIFAVAYGNNLWVAGGYSGKIRVSTDAITWTARTSNLDVEIQSVAYGNNLWVAGGQSGELRTSTDTITWVTREPNFGGNTIESIAYGNNIWVAGGMNGQLRTSAIDSGAFHVGGSTSSPSVSFATDISGSNVRLRMTIPDASTTSANVKVLTTTVGGS